MRRVSTLAAITGLFQIHCPLDHFLLFSSTATRVEDLGIVMTGNSYYQGTQEATTATQLTQFLAVITLT